jgi:Gpi18-like mannosyltransferase
VSPSLARTLLDRITRLAWATLPPVVVFALLLAAFAWAARYSGWELFVYDTWIKWDSGHYLTISERGYEFMSCAELPGYNPAHWCGNSGWFPGYPYLVGLLHDVTGQPNILLLILVSQAFALVDLLLVWTLFLQRKSPAVLLLCAFAPGTYYFLVGFPMSMTVCFLLLTLWAFRQQHYVTALVMGAIAGFTYPSGIWLAGVMATSLVVSRWRGQRSRGTVWLAILGPVIGFAAVLLVHHVTVGHWNAFLLTQEKYGHTLSNPFGVLWQRSLYIWVWKPGWQIGLQSLLAAALAVTAAILVALGARRRTDDPGDVTLATHGLAYWLVPLLMGGGISPYRAESLIVPAVTVLRRAPWFVLLPLILWAVAIWLVMATQFVQGWLV